MFFGLSDLGDDNDVNNILSLALINFIRTMKKLHIFIASLLAMSSVWTTAQTVHTIGDSTMADYNESTTDQRGWGQMFQQFFDETITVNNRGKSGASSKSFYEESAYWAFGEKTDCRR